MSVILYFSGALKHYSLLEISQSIESVISRTYTNSYWVKAELSKLNFYPHSGHCYPDLVEKKGGKIVAQMRSTIWRTTYANLSQRFRETTGENLSEGMEVLVLAQVVYKPNYGLSLNITDIDPTFTLGQLAKEKAESIERLKKEGVFEANKQIDFPYIPLRLAVISVSTSKGYHDFISILNQKLLPFRVSVSLFPALLQGDEAVHSIAEQLDLIAARKHDFDLAMILRGGGGEIGLQAYNNYRLAKAVATFPLPVIAGIGHASNETVVGMVAHYNKITPTEAANFLVETIYTRASELESLGKKMGEGSRKLLKNQRDWLNSQMTWLAQNAKDPLANQGFKLKELADKLQRSTENKLHQSWQFLNGIPTYLHQQVSWKTRHEKQNLHMQGLKLQTSAGHFLDGNRHRLKLNESTIKLLDPQKVLERGYSLTLKNGQALTSVEGLLKGDEIVTLLKDGALTGTLTEINKNGK